MNSFLYDPHSNYGYRPIQGPWAKANSYFDTYAGGLDIEQHPQDYFTHVLGTQGLGGSDARSNAARGMYGRVSDAYGAARLRNNALTWRKFLGGVDLNTMLNGMTPAAMGTPRSSTVSYDPRWLPRA